VKLIEVFFKRGDRMLSYIPLSIENLLSKVEKKFNLPQKRNFRFLILGLILSLEARNISDINDNLRREKDQSSLNRFLSESPWTCKELYMQRERIINLEVKKYMPCEVYLIIDDSVMDKRYGSCMKGAGWHWSDTHKKKIWGHCMVSSYIVVVKNGKVCFSSPLGAYLYRKKKDCIKENVPFLSKIELAIQLVDDYIPPVGTRICILADVWYASKCLIAKAREKNYDYVLPIKSNRKVFFKGRNYTPSRLARRRVHWRKVSIKKRTFSIYHSYVYLSGIGSVKLVFSKLKGKGIKYLTSNRTDWTRKRILYAYLLRWRIETFYEDAKKHLGLDQYQLRNQDAITKWWELVFCAYTLLVLAHNGKTIGKAVIDFRRLFLKSLLSKCYYFKHNALLKFALDQLFI